MFSSFFGDKKKRDDEAYYDTDDSLVRYNSSQYGNKATATRTRTAMATEEYDFVVEQGERVMMGGDVAYLVDAAWLAQWLDYSAPDEERAAQHEAQQQQQKSHWLEQIAAAEEAMAAAAAAAATSAASGTAESSTAAKPAALPPPPTPTPLPPLRRRPGRISNSCLLDFSGKALRKDAQPKVDFRPVHSYIWQFLFTRYGGGPVLLLHLPEGCSAKAYRNGTWIKRLAGKLHEMVAVVHPSANPEKQVLVNLTELVLERDAALAVAAAEEAEANKGAEALAALLAGNAEKAKLQEEAQQADGAISSAVMGSIAADMAATAAANKALAAAQEVEAAVQEVKESNVMGGIAAAMAAAAQSRRISALREQLAGSSEGAEKEGLEAQLRDMCARLIQVKYRRRLVARRQAEQQAAMQAEVDALKREAYARKLQRAWRRRLAAKKMAALKAERELIRMRKAVLLVQQLWRRRSAHKMLHARRAAKAAEEKLNAATMKIYHLMLAYIAKFKMRKKVATSQPQILLVSVRGTKGLLPAGANNVYAKVVGSRLQPASGSKPWTGRGPKPPGKHRTLSICNSKSVPSSAAANPASWTTQEPMLVCGVNACGMDSVLVRLYDKDTFGNDTFLGETEIPVAPLASALFPSIAYGGEVHLPALPLKGGLTAVHLDEKGELEKVPDAATTGQQRLNRGTVDVTIAAPAVRGAMCGWVFKLSSSVILGMPKSYKRRFLVLFDGVLKYFDDPFTLHDPRYELACADVSLIDCHKVGEKPAGEDAAAATLRQPSTEASRKRMASIQSGTTTDSGVLEVMTIAFGRDAWSIRFMEEEKQRVRQQWYGRIAASCPNLGFKSRATASTLASFPVLHNIKATLKGVPDVNSMPYAPSSGASPGTGGTSTPGTPADGSVSVANPAIRRRSSGTAGNMAAAASVVNSPGGAPVSATPVTRRRSVLHSVAGSVSGMAGSVTGAIGSITSSKSKK